MTDFIVILWHAYLNLVLKSRVSLVPFEMSRLISFDLVWWIVVIPFARLGTFPVGWFKDPLFRFYDSFAGSMPAARLVEGELVFIVARVESVVVLNLEIEVAKLVLVLDSFTHILCHSCGLLTTWFYVRRFVLEIFVIIHSRNAFQQGLGQLDPCSSLARTIIRALGPGSRVVLLFDRKDFYSMPRRLVRSSVAIIYKIVLSQLQELSAMAVSLTAEVRLILLDLNILPNRNVVKGLSFSTLEIVIEGWIVRLLFGGLLGLELGLGLWVEGSRPVFGVLAANLVEFAFGGQSGGVHFLRKMLGEMLATD